MDHPFFPNIFFGWAYAVLLLTGLGAAAWSDLRFLTIPKRLTLGLAVAGLIINTVRGLWLVAEGHSAWMINTDQPLVGGIDGFLFGFSGLLVGFLSFLLLFIFGICGGGDVKLVAAVGAWLGPWLLLLAIAYGAVAVVILTMIRVIWLIFSTGRLPQTASGVVKRPKTRLLSYSLPVAVGVAALLLVGFRHQLGLVLVDGH